MQALQMVTLCIKLGIYKQSRPRADRRGVAAGKCTIKDP